MGSSITTIRLEDDDRRAIALLRDRYGLSSTSQAIRFALRAATGLSNSGLMRTPSDGTNPSSYMLDLKDVASVTAGFKAEPIIEVKGERPDS